MVWQWCFSCLNFTFRPYCFSWIFLTMKQVFVQPVLASSNPHPGVSGKGECGTSLVSVQGALALAYFSTG